MSAYDFAAKITNLERELNIVASIAVNQRLPEPSRRLIENDLRKVNKILRIRR